MNFFKTPSRNGLVISILFFSFQSFVMAEETEILSQVSIIG